MNMRFALVSDIQRRRIGTVVNVGDTLSGPLLHPARQQGKAVRQSAWPGNHTKRVMALAFHTHW